MQEHDTILYKAGEISLDEMDAMATELWQEMQAENAEA